MKTKIFFILTAMLLVLSGCGKETEDEPIQKQNKTLNVTVNEKNACGIEGQHYKDVLGQLGDLRKDPTTGEISIVISCNNISGSDRIELGRALKSIDSAAVKNNATIMPIKLYIGGRENVLKNIKEKDPELLALMQKYGIELLDKSLLQARFFDQKRNERKALLADRQAAKYRSAV